MPPIDLLPTGKTVFWLAAEPKENPQSQSRPAKCTVARVANGVQWSCSTLELHSDTLFGSCIVCMLGAHNVLLRT